MAVKFLSPEWADQLTAALNARESFEAAAAGKKARLQQVITGETETRYWIVIDDGTIDMGVGNLEPPIDATITQSYETAVGLAQRTVNPVTGFMLGKIKVDGNMGMLMGLTGVLQELPEAMATIDTEY
ncbi:MAG TPA: SCP2 sterol-binding domain-containing protein [Actinomycetota bacterium]|nr:SCP2 sterol-binding domain-containing protein [Actinomycetota bacterium]